MRTIWIVIQCSAVGNPEAGYRCAYDWDLKRFHDKKRAISHGFKIQGSDDFNLGEVVGGKLVGLWWMDEKIDESEETLKEIQEEIGLEAAA